MNEIEKLVSDIKEQFNEVDTAIEEYETHIRELEKEIKANSNDFSMKAVKKNAARASELEQLKEGLSKAQSRRLELEKETSEKTSSIRASAREYLDELSIKKYGSYRQDIHDKITDLRKLLFYSMKAANSETSKIRDILDELREYNGGKYITEHLITAIQFTQEGNEENNHVIRLMLNSYGLVFDDFD